MLFAHSKRGRTMKRRHTHCQIHEVGFGRPKPWQARRRVCRSYTSHAIPRRGRWPGAHRWHSWSALDGAEATAHGGQGAVKRDAGPVAAGGDVEQTGRRETVWPCANRVASPRRRAWRSRARCMAHEVSAASSDGRTHHDPIRGVAGDGIGVTEIQLQLHCDCRRKNRPRPVMGLVTVY